MVPAIIFWETNQHSIANMVCIKPASWIFRGCCFLALTLGWVELRAQVNCFFPKFILMQCFAHDQVMSCGQLWSMIAICYQGSRATITRGIIGHMLLTLFSRFRHIHNIVHIFFFSVMRVFRSTVIILMFPKCYWVVHSWQPSTLPYCTFSQSICTSQLVLCDDAIKLTMLL